LRICFITPPYNSAVKSAIGTTSPPLGLAYLASMVRDDHDVRIIDSDILNYSLDDVRRELKSFYPDVVGITSATPSIYEAYKVAEIAKKVNENCKVIMGGPHVSFLPEETLIECKNVDIIVRGEGEETIRELMHAIESNKPLRNVKGITFRKGDAILSTENRPFIKNIDKIPFPSFDLLPTRKYQVQGVRYSAMISSRGCPFGCSFCASSRLFGRCWRGRSPENVLEEIKILYEKYKIGNIEFMDDTFTLNQKRAEKICDLIINEGLDISWGASSRVDTISRRLAEKMKKAGCWIIFLGIESASQKILNQIGKKISISQIRRAVKILKDAGIQILGSFILGFPDETLRSAEETIAFAKRLDLDYAQFSILTPYPGTPLYDYADKQGLLTTKNWSKYTATEPIMKLKNLTTKQIKWLFEKAYVTFYLRPKILWKWIRQKQFLFIKNTIKTAINYLTQWNSSKQSI